MADPLSIAAGVGGLIALTLQITQVTKGYIDSVKHAPKIIKSYHREILLLQSSLSIVRDRLTDRDVLEYLNERHQQSPMILQEAKDGIDGCMIDLQKRLSSIAKKDKTPSVVTSMTWYFSEAETEKDVQRLGRYKSMILDNFNNALSIGHSKHLHDLVVTAAEVDQLTQMMVQDLRLLDRNVHHVQETSDRMLGFVEHTQSDVARLSHMEDEAYQTIVLNWLSTIDPSANHNSARKLHEADTGSWLIDSPAYSDWYKNSGRFFWLYGIAGSGKTILFSTLIEDIKRRIESDAKGYVGFGYFYFDFQDTTKRSTNYLIRTLIRQLCSGDSISWTTITTLYESCSRSGQQPSQHVLLDLLVEVVDETDQTFIMIDALDECIDKEDALNTTLELFERVSGNLNILITSRHETFVEDSLCDVDTQRSAKVAVRNAAVDKDISNFVKARMEKDRKLRKWKAESNHIVESLVSQADGMFRWVACQLDALHKARSVNELHRTLQSLPKTLELTYERILAQIDEKDCDSARALLQWLAYRNSSHKIFDLTPSWTLPQIAEAIATKSDKSFDLGDRFAHPRELLDIASSLVSIDEALNSHVPSIFVEGVPLLLNVETVRLAHASVLDYLESSRLRDTKLSMFHISAKKAHPFLAQSCLRYLLFFDDKSIAFEEDSSWKTTYPLLEYAANCWGFHLAQTQTHEESSQEIYALALKVLDIKRRCYKTWRLVVGSRYSRPVAPLAFALTNNLTFLFGALIDSGHDPGEEEDTLLQAENGYLIELAIWHNEKLAVNTLLDIREKVYLLNRKDKLQEFLDLAVKNGRTEIIPILIAHGGPAMRFLPVIEAIRGARDIEARTMIRSGALLNKYIRSTDEEEATPLAYAVLFHQMPLVISLLEDGADTALKIEAALLRFRGPVRRQDIEARTMMRSGALLDKYIRSTDEEEAAPLAYELFPLSLLNDGADTALKVKAALLWFRGPVLQLAFLLGFQDIFHVLSSNGHGSIDATFETFTDYGETFVGTLLFHQISHANLVKVIVLLGKGPDLEIEHEMTDKGSEDQVVGTALHSAIFQDKIHVVKLLVFNGANLNAACIINRGQAQRIAFAPTGLWPLAGEKTRILELLLENGAQTNFVHEPEIMPPLVSHISRLRVQPVQTLLDHDADVHYDGRYGTPLYHAAHLFDKRLEKILREAGAEDVATVSYWVGL